MIDLEEKYILDVTCGARSIWFQKEQENTIFTDIRKEPEGFDPHRPKTEVCPDMVMDYRDLSFPDESFNLVVWDPPHFKDLCKKSWICKRYGSLNSETWQTDLKRGYQQIMRVLKPTGVLIMKWSNTKEKSKRSISLKEMLKILPDRPLFGHTTGSNSQTNWICFMKIPKELERPESQTGDNN